jgi:hypothetical protein
MHRHIEVGWKDDDQPRISNAPLICTIAACMRWNVGRHDSQVRRGLDEMQRSSNDVNDGGNCHRDSLRDGQDSQTDQG